MKKILFTLLTIPFLSFGQGTESFNLSSATATYADGSFTGDAGISVQYFHSRDQETYPITGNGLMLRRASDSRFQIVIPSGVGTFSFDYRKAFTGGVDRQLELLVNGTVVQTGSIFGSVTGAETAIYSMSQAINLAGPVTIVIKNVGVTTTNRQAVIDNIAWTANVGGTCSITASGITALTCNNNGTGANPADDYLTFDLNPTGSTLGTNYTVAVAGYTVTPTTGTYGSATSFQLQDGSAGGGDFSLTLTDDVTGSCTYNELVLDPGSCSSSVPVITVAPASLTGFNHIVGTPSAEQTFTASGLGLTEDITLTAPTNFEISLTTGTGFTNMLTLAQTSGNVATTTIYVRANAAAAGALTGNVTASSLGATTENVALTGMANDYVYYLIDEIDNVDVDGVADSVGVLVELSGVVHCIDFDGNAGYSLTIIDESEEGINVFKTTDFGSYTNPLEGDSVLIHGTLTQYNGLLEVVVDEITLLTQNAALFDPIIVTQLDELSESQHVKIMNVTFVTPIATFPAGNNNIDVTDGSTTFTLRIDSDTDIPGSAAPTGSFNVTGIGGQFDSSSPYTAGYQLFPCGMGSFEAACITPDNGVTMTNDSTATADAASVTYQWYNCDIDMNVAGATNQTFTATVTGNYSVIVSDGACTDTSACVSLALSNVGLNTNTLASVISLYPNPIENVVTISGITTDFYAVTVSDMNGKVVMTDSFVGKKTIETSSWLKGVYFVTIVNNDNQLKIKVIK